MKYQDRVDWWIEKIFMLWVLIAINCTAIINYYVEKADSGISYASTMKGANHGELPVAVVWLIGVGVLMLIVYEKIGPIGEIIIIVLSFIAIYFIMNLPNSYIEHVIPNEIIKAQCYRLLRIVVFSNSLLILLIWICKNLYKRGEEIVIYTKVVYWPGMLLLALRILIF